MEELRTKKETVEVLQCYELRITLYNHWLYLYKTFPLQIYICF